jgi:regulator of replication initiation timing
MISENLEKTKNKLYNSYTPKEVKVTMEENDRLIFENRKLRMQLLEVNSELINYYRIKTGSKQDDNSKDCLVVSFRSKS